MMDELPNEAHSSSAREPGSDRITCPACGAGVAADQRFCGRCGAPLTRACASCGTQNPASHRFCGQCGAGLEPAARAAAPSPPQPQTPPTPREERRWATVLFADLSGFTAMSERMDPEDVRALVQHSAEQVAEQVRRFGGTVVSIAGDGLLACFGAPLAHGDDAERAVRAALAMRNCPLAPDAERPIQLHIGVNTGEVMAGMVGPQERRDYTVLGDTVNTADRIARAAPPGSVFVGEETYRATRRAVRYGELPPIAARGKERPVPVWEAEELLPISEVRPPGVGPFVGRDDELALLLGLWADVVREAQPRLVTVLGEPGIGKSRLVAEFERTIDASARVIHGRCLPHGEALGYRALAAALKEAAGITAEDSAEVARDRLGQIVASTLGEEESSEAGELARHLALVSGLEVAADRAGPVADHRTLQVAVRCFLEALARRQPLCLMVEDIHWADDALLDMLESVATRAREAPLLIVTQARPELLDKRSTWGQGKRASAWLRLEPLDERGGQELVARLCRERGLAAEVTEQVGRSAAGNPLFAEELVAMIAERGGVSGLPGVIKALISARLDLLPEAERNVLQLASVFGKTFWGGGVRSLGADDTAAHLETLSAKDLLRTQPQSQFRGEREYAFKHDLIRDVAYETLPRATRRVLHGRVADWIAGTGEAQGEAHVDLLAHHALQAGQDERALDYLERAAARAQQAAAHRQEAALLAQAIAVAERLGRPEQIAALRARRGHAFARIGMWAGAKEELTAALEGLAAGRQDRRAEVLVDLSRASFWSFDFSNVARYAALALPEAKQGNRPELETQAMAWIAAANVGKGDLSAALNGLEEAIERARDLQIRPPLPAVSFRASILYWTGRLREAVDWSRQAVALAREINEVQMRVIAYFNLGQSLAGSGHYQEAMGVLGEGQRFGTEYEAGGEVGRLVAASGGIHLDLFDSAGAEALAEEARDLSSAMKFFPTVVSADIDLLLNFARRGEVARTEGLIDAVTEMSAKGAGAHYWLWQIRIAEARAEIALARNAWEETIRLANEAIALSRAKDRVKYTVAGLGTRGKALAALGRTPEAIADLRAGVDLARPTGDPAMLLRAATALMPIDGDDALLAEARAAAKRIVAALPEGELKQRFLVSEPVRLLGCLDA